MSFGYDMRSVAPTVCEILGVRPPKFVEVRPITEAINTMGQLRRLTVVVIDALGVSTWSALRMETPTLNALANRHLIHIHSVMPTITPVNFATMVTGADPLNHGIRERTQDIGLETVFDVLRKRGFSSGTAARALSSLGILISPHTDQPGIAESNNDEEVKILALKALLRGVELLWVQLLDVDDAGHHHGPLSPQGASAVNKADHHLRMIAVEAWRQRYGLIVLADHGQHVVLDEKGNKRGSHGSSSDEDTYVPFIWATSEEIGDSLGLSRGNM
ncbi:MAG: alkaline phosphatase family protein [Candidatus Bathyarchaeota archaeon]|jgi:predicted AlkP superfamily pyrophosphatase or phosphodiesterase